MNWNYYKNIFLSVILLFPINIYSGFIISWSAEKDSIVIDYGMLFKALIPVIFVFAIFLYWYNKLTKEIDNRNDVEIALRESMDTVEETNRALKREIESRRKIEDNLREAIEKARSANKSKSEFLANMSHEIRTPMNAVLGFTDILKRKETDPQKLHYIDNIESSGKALLSLISDILDLSKIEAGKQELQYSATSVDFLMNEMKTIFEQKINDKGIELIVDCKVEDTIVFDETRLRQIFINLIGNAIKFTDVGHIKIMAELDVYDEEIKSGADLIIKVEDTGVGIPKEQQSKIFDAFEQVKGQKISKFGGTGLGLAIILRLIEMLNGEIDLESEPGKGSCFQITFHDIEKTETDFIKDVRSKINTDLVVFEPVKVLVADDIDYNRELIIGYLENTNIEIIIAETGVEAIELVHEHKPDLLLLDMKMPEMDGYEASSIIKNTAGIKSIPIIAVTASALKQDEDLISNLCEGYLRKPINKEELVNELMRFLPYRLLEEETKEAELPVGESMEENVKNEGAESSNNEIDGDEIRLSEILKEKLEEIEKLNISMSIDAMKTFSLEVKKIAEEYHFKKLITWCEELHYAAVMFDADKISTSLDKFVKIVKKFNK